MKTNVKRLKPLGFEISMDDIEGTTLVRLEININNPVVCCNGDIYALLTQKRNDKWVYINKNVKLKNDDTIYYWIETNELEKMSFVYSVQGKVMYLLLHDHLVAKLFYFGICACTPNSSVLFSLLH